ncbi:MAG: hypothetical protein JRC92_01695 [Deltaproteobacteria bacterium]|nr:hypothetical protein [Deltaproteobacteria bacterium]
MLGSWFKKDSLDRQTRRINARIKKLRSHYEETELKGCYGDKDLAEKEAALKTIHREILELEQEREKLWAAGMHNAPTGGERSEEETKSE